MFPPFKPSLTTILLVAACMLPSLSKAQPKPLNAATRSRTIDNVLRLLRENYVFPEVAQKIETAVRERQQRKEYDLLTDGSAFAEKMTADLRAVAHDLHLRVHFSEEKLPETPETLGPPPGWLEEARRIQGRQNYGFPEVKVLKGNVGYINCLFLTAPEIAGDTYAAAMNLVANTEALIFDLRECGGSMSKDAIPMVCGYFFGSSVHLNDLYWRRGNRTEQSWSWAYVPGKRFPDKPIYLLLSGRTFSGAEELAYDLKNLKRATLVGETTGGGANGGGDLRADDHFGVFVPMGRAINPITGTNWEGVGVEPDVRVPAIQALDEAHKMALRASLKAATEPEWKNELQRVLTSLEEKQAQRQKVTFTLKGYGDAKEVRVAGSFNYWSQRGVPLVRRGDSWQGEVALEPGRHTYKFVVDGQWILDPANKQTEKDGPHTNSVLTVR